jgi:hypothetical protein
LDIWIDRKSIRVPLGTSALKEGVVVVVEEGIPYEEEEEEEEEEEGETELHKGR